MSLRQIGRAAPKSALFLAVCLFLLTACGSQAGASGASATATACAQTAQSANSFQAIIGTLKSINGKTLLLTDTQQKSVTVTYSSSTTFTQEVKITASDLKEGTPVSVVVMSTGSTYTAVSVMEGTSTRNGGPGGAPGSKGTAIVNGGPGGTSGSKGTPVIINGDSGSNPCSARQSNRSASPGTGNANSQALSGTVSQVNGNILTITDPTGASYTVTLTAQTQIIGTKNTSAAALKVGEPLTVIGKPDSQNTVAASNIRVLLSLPTRISQPAA